jgi:hypothetical protein
MATGPQAANTLTLLNAFKFDALLLSAGGNDLKNAFKEMFIKLIVLTHNKMPIPDDIASMTANPSKAGWIFEEVVGYIVSWIGLRQKSELNKDTPVMLHGYDYLQPRPAPARAWINGLPISGPWIYPTLAAAGKTDQEMREIANEVIDTFNRFLGAHVASLPNVHLLDTRRALTLAEPKSDRASNDWMDEIHATRAGWTKLADTAWNPALAKILG